MPGTVSRRKTCPLWEPGNASLPIPSFFPEFNSPFRSHQEWLLSPVRNGQRPALWTEKGPRAKDFSTTWLQATENLVFLDGVYQDGTITGTCKREQTFLSHLRSISVSSKTEISASLTRTLFKGTNKFWTSVWRCIILLYNEILSPIR